MEQKINYWLFKYCSSIFNTLSIKHKSKHTNKKTWARNRDLQLGSRRARISIQRMAEKNTMQDTILNKLNREYQMREHERAQKLKEIAEQNGVGG